MSKRIVLVGFSGAGKSTLAKIIAKHFNFSVRDTDKILEEKYKISVFDIFNKYGESVFRELEYNNLKEMLQQENVVIATGGGTPCIFDAMKLINDSAFSIYIKMSAKSLVHRLLHAKVARPLTKNKTEEDIQVYVTELLALREPVYSQAHLTVKGENFKFSDIISSCIADTFFSKENHSAIRQG